MNRNGEQSVVTVEARLYDLWPSDVDFVISKSVNYYYYRIYDLWPFTNVSARVAVLNSKFEGPSTGAFTFTTAEGGR